MDHKKLILTGLTVASLMAVQTAAKASVFSMDDFGKSVAKTDDTSKDKTEGKCGEGKCGDKDKKEGKCGEGKCGDKDKKEGSCGEGTCGSN